MEAMNQPPALPTAAPISPTERMLSLDVLRGIALLGILLVNIHEFRSPELFAAIVGIESWTGQWDANAITSLLTGTLFSGKWVLVYSFLFGIGIQLMCDRLILKGFSPAPLIAKRLGFLFAFGIGHVVFFWFGDILAVYSALGFGVLLLHRASAKITLLVATVLMAALLLVYLLLGGLATLGEMIEPGSSNYDETDWLYRHYQNCLATYAHGSWLDILWIRLLDTVMCWGLALIGAPQLLGVMLLGATVVKSGYLQRPIPPAFRLTIWALAIPALLLSSIIPLCAMGVIHSPALEYLLMLPGYLIVSPLLSLAYILLLLWLLERSGKLPLWQWIATAGRMPLTNYLSQSVIATTLFYGYGFGWYGQMTALPAVGVALGIYTLQLCFSSWWMSRHRYGPLEKIWRQLSYGKPLGDGVIRHG